MPQLNVHINDDYWSRFKELQVLLKCKTNEETTEKIILFAQTYLQQRLLNNFKTSSSTSSSNPSKINQPNP